MNRPVWDRILNELDKHIFPSNYQNESTKKRASDISPFPLVPNGPWSSYVPILQSEVEQEQKPSGNGDREAIVVGAGLCDGEGNI